MGSPMIDKKAQLMKAGDAQYAGAIDQSVLRTVYVTVAANGYIVRAETHGDYNLLSNEYIFTDPDDVAAHIAQVLEANAKAQV